MKWQASTSVTRKQSTGGRTTVSMTFILRDCVPSVLTDPKLKINRVPLTRVS